jgi:hypothetical protein
MDNNAKGSYKTSSMKEDRNMILAIISFAYIFLSAYLLEKEMMMGFIYSGLATLSMLLLTYIIYHKKFNLMPCPHCNKTIDIKVNWTCPGCKKDQGRKRLLVKRCVHCKSSPGRIYCEHCYGEIYFEGYTNGIY